MEGITPKDVVDGAVSVVKGAVDALVGDGKAPPGRPGVEPPSVDEPTQPRRPLPPKPDQQPPAAFSPTGRPTGRPVDNSQAGANLTTATGTRLRETDHSLRAGVRGPVLLVDHHLREKVMHFDHERIPERVVHARGAAAHGTFRSSGQGAAVCKAAFLRPDTDTEVFVRFSTVVGSRGSADTVRDVRGFATKFYTDEGNFDLVGNNMPVFFIQDGIKFPDLIHAAKPHPDREIPQAQTAHDTFWDFVSLHTEATHHLLWAMSDRGIPRSYRMMQGFGVHTFRVVNGEGRTQLVKFHWRPTLGTHSLLWEEAQLLAGLDPDFHRRDLADAIESGAHPSWVLALQVMPDAEDQMFAGIDLLDPTKIVPEELAPLQPVGVMTLDANPVNYFAETEQVAFHVGHLVPGIEATDDPLFAARMFSYLDTQLTRLGGPNFDQIPINRPHVPVNDMQRDGMHQTAVHGGAAPYHPNSLDGGCPFTLDGHAGLDGATAAFDDLPVPIPAGERTRAKPQSFDDHTSQARMFWLSMSAVEQDHIVAAFAFELSKCYETAIRERELRVLADVDAVLCQRVADELGMAAPAASGPLADVPPSPALSQLGHSWPTSGRTVGIVAGDGSGLAAVEQVREALLAAGMNPLVIGTHGGQLRDGDRPDGTVQRTLASARSVEYDAVLVAGSPTPDPAAGSAAGAGPGPSAPAVGVLDDPRLVRLLDEAYRHAKPVGAWGDGLGVLAAAGISADAVGVSVGSDPQGVLDDVLQDLARHRVWARFQPATRGA